MFNKKSALGIYPFENDVSFVILTTRSDGKYTCEFHNHLLFNKEKDLLEELISIAAYLSLIAVEWEVDYISFVKEPIPSPATTFIQTYFDTLDTMDILVQDCSLPDIQEVKHSIISDIRTETRELLHAMGCAMAVLKDNEGLNH